MIYRNQQLDKSKSNSCDRIPPPPPVILREPDYYPSLNSSPQSLRNYNIVDDTKFSIPPLPPNLGNNQFCSWNISNIFPNKKWPKGFRRQSLSSLHSQSSIKSYNSVRSQTSHRNYRFSHCQKRPDFYRKASSPLDSMSQNYIPNHLPNSSHLRTKCSNTRCGTGSKIRSVS